MARMISDRDNDERIIKQMTDNQYHTPILSVDLDDSSKKRIGVLVGDSFYLEKERKKKEK